MAIDTSSLSSNWKALQAKLKQQTSTDKPTPQTETSTDSSNGKLPKKEHLAHGGNTNLKRKNPTPQANGNIHSTKKLKTSNNQTKAFVPPTPANMGSAWSSTNSSATLTATKDASTTQTPSTPPKPTTTPPQPGTYIALDTEMIGTFTPPPHSLPPSRQPPHTYSILARVSLCTYDLHPLYDAYVLPPHNTPIADYRTPYSGISAWHLRPGNKTTNPKPFDIVQKEVADLLDGRVLVGHDLKGDLAVLGLSHPRADIRDTAYFPKFRLLAAGAAVGSNERALAGLSRREGGLGKKTSSANNAARETGQLRGGKKPSLRLLAKEVCGWDIQEGAQGHDSVEDARAVMAVYRKERVEFERWMVGRFGVGAVRRRRDKGAKTGVKQVREEEMGVDDEVADEDDEDEDGDDVAPDTGGMRDADAEEQEDSDDDDDDKQPANGPNKKRKKRKKKKGKYRRGGG